ncbi:Uncharacterised protein [Bordetella pertussis]|nr:Uncharacterised protein [Bordetella pertussis]
MGEASMVASGRAGGRPRSRAIWPFSTRAQKCWPFSTSS